MDIERVEILRTLKADKVWKKGAILDKKDGPLPPAIIAEVRANKSTVRVLGTHEKVAEPVVGSPEITTVDDLRKTYPHLIAQLEAEIVAEIDDRVVESDFESDESDVVDDDMLSCDECGKLCKGNVGLLSHKRMAHGAK